MQQPKKSNDPKGHHYVPQFYQKGFADSDELLWLYDRQLHLYRKVHPKNICQENDLYTIDPQGNRNSSIESQWLSRLDGEGATAIRRFSQKLELDYEWKESFSIFMAQQITVLGAERELVVHTRQATGDRTTDAVLPSFRTAMERIRST